MSTENNSTALKVFLSHQYRASVVNRYFYGLLTSLGVQLNFKVDRKEDPEEPGKKLSTNVTLLELAIQDADAFVGIYPYSEGKEGAPSRQQALSDSAYFRLEMDLAIRSGKPALVFYDRRFQGVLSFPPRFHHHDFDAKEIASSSGKPTESELKTTIERFLQEVEPWRSYVGIRRDSGRLNDVGVLLPAKGYTRKQREVIEGALEDFQWNPVPLTIERLDLKTLAQLATLRWAVAEIGSGPGVQAITGHLHGGFLPMIRLCRESGGATDSDLTDPVMALLGGVEVGYVKGVLRWKGVGALRQGLRERLRRLQIGMELIANPEEATDYFLEAARRPIKVFLSYAGADEDDVRPYYEALDRRFQHVFNYRDGKSLRSGQPWGAQLEESLADAALAVVMLSPAYLESKPCTREAELMANNRFEGKLNVIVVKLRNETGGKSIKVPGHLSSDQYIRVWEQKSDPEQIGDQIVEDLNALLEKQRSSES